MRKLLMNKHNPQMLENRPFQRPKWAGRGGAGPRPAHTQGGARGGGGGGKTARGQYILVSLSHGTFVKFFHIFWEIVCCKKSLGVSGNTGLVPAELGKPAVFGNILSQAA